MKVSAFMFAHMHQVYFTEETKKMCIYLYVLKNVFKKQFIIIIIRFIVIYNEAYV